MVERKKGFEGVERAREGTGSHFSTLIKCSTFIALERKKTETVEQLQNLQS